MYLTAFIFYTSSFETWIGYSRHAPIPTNTIIRMWVAQGDRAWENRAGVKISKFNNL